MTSRVPPALFVALLSLAISGCSEPEPIVYIFTATDLSFGLYNVRDHECVRWDGKPVETLSLVPDDASKASRSILIGNSSEYDCRRKP